MMRTPAAWSREMWREATPIGSGLLGGLVYGATALETIAINHAKLWHRGKTMAVPDVSGSLRRTREVIDQGDYKKANWIITDALKEAGFQAKLGMPCPLCDFIFDLGEREPFSHYRRYLHMDKAESLVTWNEKKSSFTRRAFLSRKRDILAVHMAGKNSFLDMEVQVRHHDSGDNDTTSMLEKMQQSFTFETDGEFISFCAVSEDGVPFGAVGRIITDGKITKLVEGALEIEGAREATLFAGFFVGGDVASEKTALKNMLSGLDKSYEYYLDESAALHEPLYKGADISLCDEYKHSNEELLLDAYEESASTELLDKLWHFGRYLAICATREDSNPFPLYGLWHGRYSMAWPHNMANENTQMIYWHALSGGLEYSIKPLLDYYLGMMDQFRSNAKNIFGLPGIYMPAGTTPGNGVPNQIVPVINNWIGAAGWLSQHFYDYYKFTGDEAELKERILPFMYEAALFYEAYLVMGDDGFYKIYPSVSPENTPGNLMPPKGSEPLSHPCPSAVNATMDVAIIKEFFTNMVEACEILGEHYEKLDGWRDIIEKLPPYQKTEDGDIREWIYPGLDQRYDHRHVSHIYPVFPGRELVKGRDSDDWLDAFELAVDKRRLGALSGWALAHMACIYARFERPEKAVERLDILSRSCLTNNLFTLHNDWRSMGMTLGKDPFAPVQLDASLGAVNALQEMLLFASDDIIKILPALPERFNKGEAKNLRFMTGSISLKWNRAGGALQGDIHAARDTKVILRLPGFVRAISLGGKEYRDGDILSLAAGQRASFSAS
ncbi:MAG: glycosyl hydrolase family 95 catalytic domain-containing protein [Christensenellales bacterium]|jgi:alpha-L-fucosidase 2